MIVSELGLGIGVIGQPASYVLDLRDEIIATTEQCMAALYRFEERHTEKIIAIKLSPTQEYCLRVEHLQTVFHVKENRPYTLEEIGQLKEFMGYPVFVDKGQTA